QYDANDPLREVQLTSTGGLWKGTGTAYNWFLNFDSTEGPQDTYWVQGSSYDTPSGRKPTDGDEVIFGDVGHDWLVGGTGRDQLGPGLPEFLYALSRSDGADPTLAAEHSSDPTRNGEPFGELGLVIKQDEAWGDQRGQPRDPQAGNIPGGPRDVLRTSGTKV